MARPNLPVPLDPTTAGNWGPAVRDAIFGISDRVDQALARLDVIDASAGGPSTTLAVSTSGNTITVTWTGVTGATGYLVGRDGTDLYGTVGSAVEVGVNVTSRDFPNLAYDTEYTFTVQPLPNGRVATVKAATSAPPVTGSDTTATAVAGDGTATLNWTPVAGATGYLVGRDGTDTSGYGAWSGTDPSSATSRVFNALVPGQTYNLFVEPQGTGKPAYPATGHGRKTAAVTPTAPTAPTGETVVTTSGITNTSITVNWTAVSGATGYLVGRDGVDSNGNGAYQTTVPAGTTTLTFSNLVPGNGYKLFVTPQPGGQRKEIQSATTVTATNPGTPPGGAGTVWLSGTGDTDYEKRTQFDTWRGEAQTYVTDWCDNQLSNMQLAGFYLGQWSSSGYTGTINLAIGGPNSPGTNTTWATAATGSMDALWRKQCQDIHANWGGLKCVHLSMAHEINGDWFPWSVNASNVAYMKQAWVRFANIVQQELKDKGRNVKICLTYAAGRPLVDAIYPGAAYVDIIGFDYYDGYQQTSSGNIRSESDWTTMYTKTVSDGSPWGFGTWITYAQGKGKPISIPEWGLSPWTQYEYDNPFWIERMHTWFKTVAPADPHNPAAGKLAAEAYFNTWTQCMLWPTTNKPLAAAKYQALKWGATV